MKPYQEEYIKSWLPKPTSFRFYGFPSQVWIKDLEKIFEYSSLPIGKWINGYFIKAPKENSYSTLQSVKRKVEDYFITMPYYECSIAKYGSTMLPRKTYGKTECLIWDLDHINIEKSYQDMQKLSKFIKEHTGNYPTVHYSGKQGFHLFIYLPYAVNDTYSKGVEYTLKLITEKAGVYVPTQEEINKARDKYEGDDKIEPEDKYWTVDPAVWGDITKSRLIRVPFTPRTNGNYCFPINPEDELDTNYKENNDISHTKLVWNELVTAIINNQRVFSRINAEKQQVHLDKRVRFKNIAKDKYVDFNDIDCKTVWNDLFPTKSTNGDFYRAYCPLCGAGTEKKQPSIRIFSDGFFCHACKKGGKAYTIAMMKFNDKEKAIKYLRGV